MKAGHLCPEDISDQPTLWEGKLERLSWRGHYRCCIPWGAGRRWKSIKTQRNYVHRNYGVPLIQKVSDKPSVNGNVLGKNALCYIRYGKEIENKSRLCTLNERGMNRCKISYHKKSPFKRTGWLIPYKQGGTAWFISISEWKPMVWKMRLKWKM